MSKSPYKDTVIAVLVVVLIITIIVSISAYYNNRDRLLLIIDKLTKELDDSDRQITKLTAEKNALLAEKAKKDSTSSEFPGSGLTVSDKDKKIRELENKIKKLVEDIKNINNLTNEYKVLINSIKDFMLSLNVGDARVHIDKIGSKSPDARQHIIDAFNLILEKRQKVLQDIINDKNKQLGTMRDLRIRPEEVALLNDLIRQYGSITNLNNELRRLQNQKGSIVERLKAVREQFVATQDNIDKLQRLIKIRKGIPALEQQILDYQNDLAALISERDALMKELDIIDTSIEKLNMLLAEKTLEISINKGKNIYNSLVNNVDFVRGYNGKNIINDLDQNNKHIQGRTPEECRQIALKEKYPGWGWRTYAHPEENLRGTCYFYTTKENLGPYAGDPTDMIHITGCTEAGYTLSSGCTALGSIQSNPLLENNKINAGDDVYSSIMNNINYVRGYTGQPIRSEDIQGMTPEECRQNALKEKHPGWGWRTYAHPEEKLRGTCYYYDNKPEDPNKPGPYTGNIADTSHITGCTNAGYTVASGCIEPTPIQPDPTPIQPEPTPIQPEPTPIQPEPTPIQPPIQTLPIQPEPEEKIPDDKIRIVNNFLKVLNANLEATHTPEELLDYIRASNGLLQEYFSILNINTKESAKNVINTYDKHFKKLNQLQNRYEQVGNNIPISYLRNTILLGYDVAGHRIGQFNDGLHFDKNFKGSIIKEMEGVCDNNKYCNSMTYGIFNNLVLPVYKNVSTYERDANWNDGSVLFGCDSGMVIKDISAEVIGDNGNKIQIDDLSGAVGENKFAFRDYLKQDYMPNVFKRYNAYYTCAADNNVFLNSIDSKSDDNSRKSNIAANSDYNVYVSKPEYINWETEAHGYDSAYDTVNLSRINKNGMIFTRDYDVNPSKEEEIVSLDDCIAKAATAGPLGSYTYYDVSKNKHMCGSVVDNNLYKRSIRKGIYPKIIYFKPGVVPKFNNY